LPWSEPAAAAGPERAEQVEARFRSELRAAGLDGEWQLLDERDLSGLVGFANIVDLTIFGQESPDKPDDSGSLTPDRVVTEIGRPMLIVPYAGRFETVGRRALIAWDGSREAARALDDARCRCSKAPKPSRHLHRRARGAARARTADARSRRPPFAAPRDLGRRRGGPRRRHPDLGSAAVAHRGSRCRPDRRGRLSPFADARGIARRRQPRSAAPHDRTGADVALRARAGARPV
jgi:hypothetical protein